MNKKGSVADLFLWVAIGIIILIFFGAWIYGFGLLSDNLTSLTDVIWENNQSKYQTIGQISQDTIGKVENTQKDSLHVIAFVMLFFMGISIPVTYFIQKTHPVFFIVFLLITIAAFIMAVYVSNQYETLLTNEVLGTTLSEFTGANYIMLNLPIWVAVIGMIGCIFLFGGILRDYGAGGAV